MIVVLAVFVAFHVARLFFDQYSSFITLNLDAQTYAGNLENLKDVEGEIQLCI